MRTLLVTLIITVYFGLAAFALLRGELLGGSLAVFAGVLTLPTALGEWLAPKEEE